MNKRGVIKLEQADDSTNSEYVTVIWINEKPQIILDVRDDFPLPIDVIKQYPEALIFKSNYSSEAWQNPKIIGFENWYIDEHKNHLHKVRPWIIGRMFKMATHERDFAWFNPNTQYDMMAFIGEGINAPETMVRIKILDLLKQNTERNMLVYYKRSHFKDADKIPNYEKMIASYCNKEHANELWGNYGLYRDFLALGKWSINIPGIHLSQPFRCIDAVLAGRTIVSTKIWVDIYKDFPCVMLPICGFTGEGDWNKAGEIIKNLNNIDVNKMYSDSVNWYTKYLSIDGLWQNQFLKNIGGFV